MVFGFVFCFCVYSRLRVVSVKSGWFCRCTWGHRLFTTANSAVYARLQPNTMHILALCTLATALFRH